MVDYIKLENAVNNLFANWIEDEESCYLEDLDNMLQENKFKNCKYHLDLKNNKIALSDIPTDKLCDGYNYTDLRILEDYITEKRGENE
jgi:hypothetical protein